MVYSAAPGQVPQDVHVVRAGRCKSRDECPAEKQLALSDRTPSVRLTDFLTDCSGLPRSHARFLRACIQLGPTLRTPPLYTLQCPITSI